MAAPADPPFETDPSGARERRRDPRLPVRVPLLLARGDAPPQEALAAVISRVGALVLTAAELREGEEIELRRPSCGLRAAVRVVAGAGADPESRLSKYGVEFVVPRPDFWGLALSGDPDSDDADA